MDDEIRGRVHIVRTTGLPEGFVPPAMSITAYDHEEHAMGLIRNAGPQAHRHDFPVGTDVDRYDLGALWRCTCGEVRALHSSQRDGKYWDSALNEEERAAVTSYDRDERQEPLGGRADPTTRQWGR